MTAPLDPAPPPKSRKRWIGLSILALAIVAAGIGGFIYWLHARQFEDTDDAYVDGDVVPVSPQVAGRIKAVYVVENQNVSAGDKIAEIDPTDFITRVNQAQAAIDAADARVTAAAKNVELVTASASASVAQAQAGVAQAEAEAKEIDGEISEAEATVRWAEAQQQSAQSDVDAAQAEADRRNADLKRYDAVDPRALSQQVRDAARAAADSANAQLSATKKRKIAADAQVAQEQSKLEQVRSKMAAAKSHVAQAQGVLQTAQTGPQQIASAQAQVATAQAAVAQAKQDLQAAREQLNYTTIVAPVAGRVTRKSLEPGQYVDAGRILLNIVEPDVWITANFKETQLTRMRPGQSVDIRVDTYPGQEFKGHVDSIQSGTGARFSLMPPENATGNYVKVVQRVPVKILLDDSARKGDLLALGMSVEPKVHVMEEPSAPPLHQAPPPPAVTSAAPAAGGAH